MAQTSPRKRKTNPRTIPFTGCRILFKEPRGPLYLIRQPTAALIYEGLLFLEPGGFLVMERNDGARLCVEGSIEKRFLLWREQIGKSRKLRPRRTPGLQTEKLLIAFAKKKVNVRLRSH